MDTRLTIPDMDRLMTRVNAVALMSDPAQRGHVLAALQRVYGDQLDPARFPGSSRDNWTIVTTCIDEGAMSDLSLVLKGLGGPTKEWAALDALVGELFDEDGRMPVDAVEQVRQSLATVSGEVVAAALAHEALRGHGVSRPTDASEVFDQLLAGPQRDLALSFVELVAHQLDERPAVDLHWSIDELALEFGVADPIKTLCRSLRKDGGPVSETGDGAPTTTGPHGPTASSSLEEDDVRTLIGTDPQRENETEPATPQVWGGVPPRNHGFTGRAEVLEKLRRTLSSHATSALVAPLHGFGGIGKSQIATEFAYRYGSHYNLVWWIQADDHQSRRRSLVSLARRLGLPESENVEDTVETVLDALRRGDPHRRWLLIYDDADEPNEVKPYVPVGAGHVLITSRSRTWASEEGALELDVFTPQESVSLVRRRWKTLTETMALELARRLGHLPLALDQAVSVHEQTGMPLADYLRALDEHPAEIMGEGAAANYASSVAQTLALSFQRLRVSAPAAARLLELCVFLSSHPIAIRLLSDGQAAELPEDLRRTLRSDIALRRAIRDLGRFALVQLDPGRDFIRVHNLVRAVLRDGIDLDARAGLERAAHAVLAAANPRDPDNRATWHAHARIAPHVIPSGLLTAPEDGPRRTVLDQVRYHYMIGDYAVSRALGQATRDHWRASFGENDEYTLVVSRHLGDALRALGEYRAARDLNQDTLSRMIATLDEGADHEHSLRTANSVGADLRLVGQFRQALALDEDNLRRHEAVFGPNDAATIRVMNNLAVDCRLLGDFVRSRELDEANLERKQSLYGDDDPRTLFTYTCLVRDLYGQGRYREGLLLAQDKIPVYEQRLDPSHRDVLIARRHLAMLQRKAGYIGLALSEALQVHELSATKFGPAHEHSLSSLMTLMNCRRAADDPHHAVESGRVVLAGYRDLLGPEHPFTFACTVDVAIVLRLTGALDESQQLADDAAAGLSGSLGEDHPYTLCARHTQANGLAAADRMDEARAVDEQVLDRSRHSRGEDHPYTLACAVNLALDLDACGEQAASHTLRRATLERIKRVLGPGHPDTANVGLYIRTETEIEVPAT